MEHHYFKIIRQGFAALALFMLTCLSAHAAPFVVNKAGDEVLDLSTGWVWMRCSLGQSWNGQTCVGEAKKFKFTDAEAAARSHQGWVVPSVAQLVSLRVCSAGVMQSHDGHEVQGGGQMCRSGSNEPAINTSVFPETPNAGFVTSSRERLRSNELWVFIFSSGNAHARHRNSANGNYDGLVRLVRASQLLGGEAALAFVSGRKVPQQADFAPEVWAQGGTLEQSLGAVPLPWQPKTTGNNLPLPFNAPAVDLQKMAADLKALALLDSHQAPVVGVVSPPKLAEPVREAFQPRPVSIPAKGEFETTAAYEARKQQAEKSVKDSAEQAYQSALRDYNAEQLAYKQQQAKQEADNAAARAQAEARKTDPQAYRSALLEAWKVVTTAQLGDPVLQNIAYDADRQVFTAKLLGSHGVLLGDVTAPVPLAQAPAFKADLLSGKIAPKVTFAYPSMRLDWALIENSAQRSARFAAAQNSISDLEALMREFPNAPEVGAAKRRVQALIAQEFGRANTSTQLQSVLNQYPNAADAPAARKRVEQLRLAEQRAEREAQEAARRAEREAQEAARRQREWENSPQGQAQRQQQQRQQQQRQMCEAQKQTCLASCPAYNHSRGASNDTHFNCERRCNSISCY